ncbi:uncharacterized protein LOC143453455 [Clavelina lepadiformis]|uniref:uncharacterized protein LOC143453455 n=1 Tax=Clavelina lepadiformis TaxID=159417 RepID=UPI0040435FFB
MKKSVLWILVISSLFIGEGHSFSRFCYVNQRSYRIGETTVELLDGNIFYRCTCRLSFEGRAQRNCSHSSEDGHVIIADVNRISKVLLGGGFGFKTDYIRELRGTPVAVDVDVANDYIYWSDVSRKQRGIYRARYSDGRVATRIVSEDVFEPNGLAVDWLSRNIYWTDAQLGAIFVARHDGSKRVRLIGGLSEPRSLALLPREGLMFWSDQSTGTIEMAKMDGSGRRVVITGLVWPNEIAINYLERTVFWVDGSTRRIESCDFDGQNYKLIYDFSYTFKNPAFGLSLFANHLYFGVWNDSSLYSITKIGQHFKRVVGNLGSRPMGITTVNERQQQHQRKTNPCWYQEDPGSAPCSHICLPKSYNDHRCACPSNTGLVLSSDRRNCVVPENFLAYTSIDEGTVMILSTDLGASKSPSMLAQSHQPSAVAFDPAEKVVYWSDVAMNAIYRKPLNDSPTAIFLQDGIGTVDGLCVDYVNGYLYFTNMGDLGAPFHQIEMVNLKSGGNRKILTSDLLEKPRDLVIDFEERFLYVSDWGNHPKIVRYDLDGKHPQVLDIDVENPNGLALDGNILYVTDSHAKSAIIGENGTVIYGEPPKMIQYFTSRYKDFEMTGISMEVPFGLTFDLKKNRLYFTDWGFGGIYEVDPDGVGGTQNTRWVGREFLIGISKPTGIIHATTKPPMPKNICKNIRHCSDVCVPISDIAFSCVCPDSSTSVLSADKNCVEPDEFILVADVNRIVMKSFVPSDPQQYVVVNTYDTLSNIVALTFDPVTRYVYWADNGRQRISRQSLASGNSRARNIEIIYSNIGTVDGMTLDSDHRLLYWTDREKGTIELLDLNRMEHATVLKQLTNPRAIVLYPQLGLMYWTEWGDYPMLNLAKMNGQDPRMVGNSDFKWPNGLFFDENSKKLFISDGGQLNIRSVTLSSGIVLDSFDRNGTAGHMYGVWKYQSSLIYSDWVNRDVVKTGYSRSDVIMSDLIRPSQIYVQEEYQARDFKDQCYQEIHRCSHICLPGTGTYVCLCPDDLTLAPDKRSCVTEEQAKLLTSTIATPITSTPPYSTTSTAKWADLIVTTQATNTTTIDTTTMTVTTDSLLVLDFNVTEPGEEPQTIASEPPSTTISTQPTTTSMPKAPYFVGCNEKSQYEVKIPDDSAYLTMNVSFVESFPSLTVFDGRKEKIEMKMMNSHNLTVSELELDPDLHIVTFYADDDYGRRVTCSIIFDVIDATPPFLVSPCPSDMKVETYSDNEEAYVIWESPNFADNSGVSPVVVNNYDPGSFSVGFYNVSYQARDRSGNVGTCIFQLGVITYDSPCLAPASPTNGHVTCTTDPIDKLQKCRISCDPEHHLSLADPYIKCVDDGEDGKKWIPLLNRGICKKPSVSHVKQDIVLQYICPCRPSPAFYEARLIDLESSLKTQADCPTRPHQLGLCRDKGKVIADCIDEKILKFTVTVDLYSLRGLTSTKDVRQIVTRSATKLLDSANFGDIVTYGLDNRKVKSNYTTNSVSEAQVVCSERSDGKRGFIATKEGCVPCPKGTYLVGEKCDFCPMDTYQNTTGQQFCQRCPGSLGTHIPGASDKSYCKVTKDMSSGSSGVILIAVGVVGGVLVLVAVVIVVVFIRKRKRNNRYKKEQERKRREQEARRRRHNQRKRARQGGRSEREKNKGRTTSRDSAESKSQQGNRSKDTPSSIPSTRSVTPVVTVTPPPEDDARSGSSVAPSSSQGTRSVKSLGESTGPESAIFTDGASDTVSVVSSEPPLKSALKKRRNPPPPESVFDDDTSTVISASTITSAQLKRVDIKKRSTSLDDDVRRGRSTTRSSSMRAPSVSPTKLRNSFASCKAQPNGMQRSMSFDRGNSRPNPQRMFPPRFNRPLGPSPPQMVRMPPPGVHMPHNYVTATPRPGVPIYGAYPFRMRPPMGPRGPMGPRMYQPAPMRLPYMGPRTRGSLPFQPNQPHRGGNWNGGYDNIPDWESMNRGNDTPNRSMTLPRPGMMPRYQFQERGIPGASPYQSRRPPPPYYA